MLEPSGISTYEILTLPEQICHIPGAFTPDFSPSQCLQVVPRCPPPRKLIKELVRASVASVILSVSFIWAWHRLIVCSFHAVVMHPVFRLEKRS